MLQEQISIDLRTAMKNKDENVKSLLRVVIGEFSREGKELSDEQVIKIVKKMKENAIEMNNQVEVDILDKYIPQMISRDELYGAIFSLVKLNNITDMKGLGKVMGGLKTQYGSRYDGKVASELFKSII